MKRAAERGREEDEEEEQQHQSKRSAGEQQRVVYWGSGSSAVWRVLLCLERKNLQYQSNMIEFSSGILKTAKMLAMNPRGQVPILVDSPMTKTPIYESLAILMYLEKFYSPVRF